MKQVKVSEASGIVLDWLVAKCEEASGRDNAETWLRDYRIGFSTSYSTTWSQAGPIIEREGITVSKEDGCWSAYFRDNLFEGDGSEHWSVGETPLIAAMRCYVASNLGDTVEVPKELTE